MEFSDDPAGFTKSLLQEDGKDIWVVGGAQIISLLLNAGLVRSLIVTIVPVLLAEGIPLFTGLEKEISLRLTASKHYPSKLVQLHYEPSEETLVR